jgi:hypothetical protein
LVEGGVARSRDVVGKKCGKLVEVKLVLVCLEQLLAEVEGAGFIGRYRGWFGKRDKTTGFAAKSGPGAPTKGKY